MGVGNALLVFIFIVSFFFFVLLMLAIMPNYGFFSFYPNQKNLCFLYPSEFILAYLPRCSMCSLL